MAYLSLYRKWRPQDFSDIAGQKNIVKTLKNAIELDRIAHAYLFCGPRGTGKTSTAKVLAKALNCKDAPTTSPCDSCEVCNKITNNNSMDVIEIDAASNRGIDKIRELREKVKFSPTEGEYKIYIIDEVHMLTKEAFNALLKTLEEPPDYVIFILATTEPHKLLPTILSRCQRFDFKRLSEKAIIERLKFIAQQEEIEIADDALSVIARYSNGGMRDAISILDQAISFAKGKIDLADIEEVLGVVGKKKLFEILDIIVAGDVKAGIDLINQIIAQGADTKQLVNDLIYHCRNLLLAKECQNINRLINGSQEFKEEIKAQAKKLSKKRLFQLLEHLTELEYNLKNTVKAEIIIEMGLVKLIREQNKIAKKEFNYDGILNRLTNVEQKLAGKEIKQEVKANPKFKNKDNKNEKDNYQSDNNKELETKPKVTNKKTTKKEVKKTTDDFEPKDSDLSLADIKSAWDKVIKELKKKKKMQLYSVLQHNTKLTKLKNNKLFIKLENESSFYKETLYKGKTALTDSIQKVFGPDLRIEYVFSDYKKKSEKEKIMEDELVKEVMELFSGEVVKIENID